MDNYLRESSEEVMSSGSIRIEKGNSAGGSSAAAGVGPASKKGENKSFLTGQYNEVESSQLNEISEEDHSMQSEFGRGSRQTLKERGAGGGGDNKSRLNNNSSSVSANNSKYGYLLNLRE